MKGWSAEQLKQDRYEKFRKIGSVTFEAPASAVEPAEERVSAGEVESKSGAESVQVEASEQPLQAEPVKNLSGNAE
jgi:acetyl-CoA carboxylase carboxyl transferase subunit alpha